MRLLIADDDAVARLALMTMLRKRGHEVFAAGDGMAAWEALGAPGGPRLAILDWQMPGLDGPEVCRRIRSEPGLRGLYLILLTSRAERADILAGLRAGANDYMTKP